MKFSIIIPSFNQEAYIEKTLQNAVDIKKQAETKGCEVEILLFDSESNELVQSIINRYRNLLDYVEVKKDKGQYDAINKGILKCSGDYWSWLNTDDLIEPNGFFKLTEVLKTDDGIDYIYGGVDYIDGEGRVTRHYPAFELNFRTLYSVRPGIFQPGSFFRKSFSDKIGLLKPYQCCFDYEYILRCMDNNARIHCCRFVVSNFRFYKTSKTGSIIPVFIREQLEVSKEYGRKPWHFLSYFSHLRLLKHTLFPRR